MTETGWQGYVWTRLNKIVSYVSRKMAILQTNEYFTWFEYV